MNVLVYPHQMVIGGSQINALELGAAVRDRGHNVTVVAPDGVLTATVEQLGLPFVSTIATTEYPSPRTCLQLIQLARHLNIDIIHAYEWRPALEATFGSHLIRGTPVLITVLSMNVPTFLPTHIPLVVGTHELTGTVTSSKRDTYLIEPPIDTERNCSSNVAAARARWSIDHKEVVVSVVCRLTTDLEKLQGVLQAIDSVSELAALWPVKLVIAGGGDGMSLVERRAALVNARHGRRVIHPVGPMLDPQDIYELADIVIGMGSSVLRGMSFSKPVIVQGTSGFWRLLDQSSLALFLGQGWFGHGGQGASDLSTALLGLLEEPARRAALGNFGRAVVVERFSLNQAADRLLAIYEQTIARRTAPVTWARSMIRSAARVAKFRAAMALKDRSITSVEGLS